MDGVEEKKIYDYGTSRWPEMGLADFNENEDNNSSEIFYREKINFVRGELLTRNGGEKLLKNYS